MFLAYFINTDYSWYGVGLICVFYFLRRNNPLKFIYAQLLNGVFCITSFIQLFAFVGLIPVYLYNGQQGKKIGRIYYAFYALHLSLFYAISLFI